MSCPVCHSPEPGTCLLNDTGPHLHTSRDDCCTAMFHAHLHVITERADGPDLDDLVRLIRYLREHGVGHAIYGGGGRVIDLRPNLTVSVYHPDPRRTPIILADGAQHPEATFVGPDGTVYDANREAL